MYPAVIQQLKDIVALQHENIGLYSQQLRMGCVSDYIYPRVTAACDSRSHHLQLSGLRIHSCTIKVELGVSVKNLGTVARFDCTIFFIMSHSALLYRCDV
jgi:hypothetical protein